jgi:hypothetical protein
MKMTHWSLLLVALAFTACASLRPGPISGRSVSKTVLHSQTRAIARLNSNHPTRDLRARMARFSQILRRQSSGQSLSANDWQLHDTLLADYASLRFQATSGDRIVIPAHSRISMEVPSFCLDSGAANPSSGERFSWRRANPGIPYYQELMRAAPHHPDWRQEDLQALIWNLQSETDWERYPDRLKNILRAIDPQAPQKLPSRFKSQTLSVAEGLIRSHVPGYDSARSALGKIRGEYHEYEDTKATVS